MEASIATHGLTKAYGDVEVVSGLDMVVPAGSVYGFLGPNGAGKTTTMKMLLGLVHASSGTSTVLGETVSEKTRTKLNARIGSLIENPSCYPHLTARENLEIVRSLRGLPESAIDEALATVHLTGTGTKPVRAFSLGMRQRLGLATALMGRPELLLLDEPTNGLDPAGIQEIRELIRALPGEYGCTVLVSSHLLSEIDQMSDHVGIISRGRMVWQGPMGNLHAQARRWLSLRTTDNERAAQLLGASYGNEGWLNVVAADDDLVAWMTLLLAAHGIAVLRLEERREDLEDIFLQLTGKGAL
ncbi:Daunorubicin/doxorubicin resistance ATP-binding protein DrrA [Slackia heliotrinireducens]|uniref:ABC-type multidrug transport system, ATPase component n=1 Tax=Slackia heliotrinireducens (strain ATCC 29202 / DSM 20476 / NCTC 11029 / RHS 1) TaxID=471855 RepID=C7N3P5_SLAHD|nr:ABC transporter ATP-binding protein [Slackia heliotrinireducens]ACV21636.1 ABC-type multidrug transport system, ATPase component [Slackia heliotrinireducens DSM 20476]VEG99214.1 Daunorubicin/doxorubicin resistance ATP-binding protein DrrA [Slackia heliotrinireducens]